MLNKSVVLDTSFWITLLDSTRSNHDVAKRYYQYLLKNDFLLYLSTIAISEYCHRGELSDLPLDKVLPLPFNTRHAVASADLNFKSRPASDDRRDTAKDDFKLLAQAKCENAGYLITDDSNSLATYAHSLVEQEKLELRCIALADGFDVALVNDDQQRELPDSHE